MVKNEALVQKHMGLKARDVFGNPWSFTIAGTMLGVLAAFFLNDWRQSQSAKKFRNEIFDKIYEEIISNQQIVEDNKSKLDAYFLARNAFSKYPNTILSPQEMADFKRKHPTYLTVVDSVQTDDKKFDYKVQIILDIPTINQLSNFAWIASKTSEIYSQVDFECLYWFETTYSIQEKLSTEFKELFQVFSGSLKVNDLQSFLSKKITLILAYEEILLTRYREGDAKIRGCKS